MEQQSEEMTITQLDDRGMHLLREKANIDTAVATAKAYPRDLEKFVKNSLFTVNLDAEIAAACGYAVPRGGKAITGPSVHLAKILMQNYGNFRGEAKVVEETAKHVVSEAIAWDLESNVAVKVTVKRSIMQNKGKDRMNEDMITVTGNAANSISLRNAIFNVIPKAFTDKVYKAAQQRVIGAPDEFSKRLKKVIDGFKKVYNKDQSDVLGLVGKTELSQIDNDDLVVLIGVGQALKDGDTTVEVAFKGAKDPIKDPIKEAEDKKAAIKEKRASEKDAAKEADPATEKDAQNKDDLSKGQAEQKQADSNPGALFNAEQMP